MSDESTASFTSFRDDARLSVACLVLGIENGSPQVTFPSLGLHDLTEVCFGRGTRTTTWREGSRLMVQIRDSRMSSQHTRIAVDAGAFHLNDAQSKNGSFVNGHRVASCTLSDGDVVEMGSTFFVFKEQFPTDSLYEDLVSDGAPPTYSADLREIYRELKGIARADLPVLVCGETGTGKELTARLLHRWSGRPGAFCAVNCAAIPSALAESTLFGHKKGSFSGAVNDSPGFIRAAQRGTLFLDEIAELDAALQPKLLRALQEREVTPLGETAPVPVDFRLVAATHENLDELCTTDKFRADLLARLDGHRVTLPPLRYRLEDLGLLIRSLSRAMPGQAAAQVVLDRGAARAFYAYSWPRNVRELGHALERGLALAQARELDLADLPSAIRAATFDGASAGRTPGSDEDKALRARLISLLTEHHGNVSVVARALGKARVQIRRWCKRYGLNPETFRAG